MGNKLWHDFLENPNDLPVDHILQCYDGVRCVKILIMSNDGHVTNLLYWCDFPGFIFPDVIKWCYVEELINIDKDGK